MNELARFFQKELEIRDKYSTQKSSLQTIPGGKMDGVAMIPE